MSIINKLIITITLIDITVSELIVRVLQTGWMLKWTIFNWM